jgi:hypothetical protein
VRNWSALNIKMNEYFLIKERRSNCRSLRSKVEVEVEKVARVKN